MIELDPDYKYGIDPCKVRLAFACTAQACGGDILQMLQDCGEPGPHRVERGVLYEYLQIHGGVHGKEVEEWLHGYTGDLEATLNEMNVPESWV